MSGKTRLFLRLILLGAVGVLADLLDAGAQRNSIIVLGIIEFELLALWVGVDLKQALRGTLKAGPEKAVAPKAIHLPYYQVMLAAYFMVLAGVAIFGAKTDAISQFINSPFLVWLIATPAVATAFIVEYRAERQWHEN